MRNVINLNKGWKFIQEDAGLPVTLPVEWSDVDLPHTWNNIDGHDGNGKFFRGKCWYATTFDRPEQPLKGGRVYVEILAAGHQATVYINGVEVTYHEGGYSIFRADLTDHLKDKDNLLVVACDNSYKDSVYPQMADFTFYGGLYRGVNLVSVAEAHFDLDFYGTQGLKVTPRPTESGDAEFELESWTKGTDENHTVNYFVYDKEGNEVAMASRPADNTKVTVIVPDAHLWNIDDPYLYTVKAELIRRNEVTDEVSTRVGVRSFAVTPDKGFSINGVDTPLRGVSRHQDQLYKGYALSREDHFSDAHIIKDLGANTIRLAHYQHSGDFYDACDELGFAVWAEIPFISKFNPDPAAHQNCISQMKELVYQNYNRPSIMFWGLSNEILIGGISEQLIKNHEELNELVKSIDTTRLTTIAHVSSTPIDCPLHHIPDIVSYNHYFGWYSGKMEENGPWMDNFHKVHPDVCVGLSEYGCEGIITYHSNDPRVKDYSEDYQALYHEHMAKMLDERPWIWSSHVWNMFDFGCGARNEGGVGGRNNKGLVTMDRKIKKDSYYIYRAYWNTEPMVHLCGKRYAERAGETTEIKVYSNLPEVTLYQNGTLVGTTAACEDNKHVFKFTVTMADGFNTFKAVAGECKDTMTIEKVEKEPAIYVLPEFNERMEGVANWFETTGSMDLTKPMEFPEGKWSVKDKISDIYENCPEGFEILKKAVKIATGFALEPGEGFWDFLKNNTVEGMMGMAAGMPDGFLESINAQLIEFDK